MQTRRGRFAVAASAPFCSLRAPSLRPSLLSILPVRSLIRLRSLSVLLSLSNAFKLACVRVSLVLAGVNGAPLQ